MQLTDEQLQVVRSRARRLAVQAGAGAAKTTTLCAYAQERPAQRILYLAFNKAIQLEAASKMPANVMCRTTHSIAWRKAKDLFGEKAGARVGSTYPSSVARAFACTPLAASAALQSIQRWCGSLEETLGAEHVPADIAARMADPRAIARLVELARSVWGRMTQPGGGAGELKLPHDGYLKLFQMERPVLRGFDVIAVDEAQDLNPCTFDIVRRQKATVVMVGDAAQAIYSFRGATNALLLFDAEERLPLSRSFRFGQGIAALANALLGHFKGSDAQTLIGAGQPQKTRLSIDTERSFAVIARTNAVIFEEAVGFLGLGRRYHFVGGAESYKLEKILDTFYLSIGERSMVRDPYLKTFGSIDELAVLAEESDEPELKHLVRVVTDYGSRVPGLIDEIKSRHHDLPKEAWGRFDGIFLSTAHKSKGLEFEQVWLADDYLRFFEDGRELGPEEVEQEEVNILYVALTRARAAIRLNDGFQEWLEHRRLMPACVRA
jgi:F-box protein, helicase, 18